MFLLLCVWCFPYNKWQLRWDGEIHDNDNDLVSAQLAEIISENLCRVMWFPSNFHLNFQNFWICTSFFLGKRNIIHSDFSCALCFLTEVYESFPIAICHIKVHCWPSFGILLAHLYVGLSDFSAWLHQEENNHLWPFA